jgi:hypothetical protein
MIQTVQPRRLTDVWGWTLAGFLSVVSLSLPGYLQLNADRQATLLVTSAALFISGALMGFLRPVRVWRWPVAAMLAFAVWDILQAAREPGFVYPVDAAAVANVLASSVPADGLFALPVLAGAFAGASMLKAGLE